jgi:hypothetical protein
LNIKILSQNNRKYSALFINLSQLEKSVKIIGTRYGVLGRPQKIVEDGKIRALRGYFYHFTEIDPRKPWFNMQKFRQLDLEDGEPLPIAPEWKPNSREVLYFFHIRTHLLFFDVDAIGHEWARRFFAESVSKKAIVDEHGIVEVEVVSSSDTIERILSIPTLTRLQIILSRPNGDDPDEIIQRVIERMEAQKARHYEQVYKGSIKEGGLEPDPITKAHMKLAIKDGQINAVGRDIDNVRVVESTEDHPRVITEAYDPQLEDRVKTLERVAEGVILEEHKRMD